MRPWGEKAALRQVPETGGPVLTELTVHLVQEADAPQTTAAANAVQEKCVG